MKETATVICVLLIFCYCPFTTGDNKPSLPSLNVSLLATASPPQNSSTVEIDSLTNSSTFHLNASSEADSSSPEEASVNATLSLDSDDTRHSITTHSTEAPATPGTTPVLPVNGTSVPGNLTDGQEGSDLSAGDNQTISTSSQSTTAVPTTITLLATLPPKAKPHTSTSAPSTQPQTLPASTTRPQRTTASVKSETTSPEATTVLTRHKSSTATAKDTTAPSKTMQTTEAGKAPSNTIVPAKARADTPSELNVGDDDSRASMDPLLAGLVSVFVVTAAIVSLLIFLKFRHRNERPEFRRLQDLPMDDMMEDTPLSMYSY